MEVCKLLVESQADVNVKDKRYGERRRDCGFVLNVVNLVFFCDTFQRTNCTALVFDERSHGGLQAPGRESS
jgi:hypothetical protein